MSAEESAKMREHAMNLENERKNSMGQSKRKREAMTATTWRDLIPVIKIDICSVIILELICIFSIKTFSI